jgi:hypothetical protein
MSLIHLKDGTLGSRVHCVSIEQKISELFTTLPSKPGDLNLLNVRRSGRSSDNEVYEMIFKVRKVKVLAALYWLVKYNVLYQVYEVLIEPSNLDWMGDEMSASCQYHVPPRLNRTAALKMTTWGHQRDRL